MDFTAHARESGHPVFLLSLQVWVPAFAGTSGLKLIQLDWDSL